MSKCTQVKVCRTSRLRRPMRGTADVVCESCFSAESKAEMKELFDAQKITYVGESINPYFGNALFAGQDISKDELICPYYGNRMSVKESEARIKAGCNSDYMINVGRGVVVDGFGVGYGACMANQSCEPNCVLVTVNLNGFEKAPIGYLRALRDIKAHEELEAWYGYWNPEVDELPDLNDLSAYRPCKCLKKSCRKVSSIN